MYKAILFDFFDVIHRDPFQHWLKESGLERGGELHESSKRLDLGEVSAEEHYKHLSKLSGQPVQQIKAVFDDTNLIDNDMVELIRQLKSSYKTGLLSNSSTEYIWQIIKQHNIESLFDVIIVSAEVKLIKPDPRIFDHIMNKLGLKAAEAIFIDDNPNNVAAAAALGIEALVYKDIGSLKQELAELGVLAR